MYDSDSVFVSVSSLAFVRFVFDDIVSACRFLFDGWLGFKLSQNSQDQGQGECMLTMMWCDVTQNHPVSGIPTYFVHPCNTADALRDVANPKSMPDTSTYLLLWLGLVGGCVGLHVPKSLVAGTMTERETEISSR